MRLLWPTKLNSEPNALIRFGRVLHWMGTGLAASVIALTLGTFGNYSANQHVTIFVVSAGIALVLYFTGRALRYIFSGE